MSRGRGPLMLRRSSGSSGDFPSVSACSRSSRTCSVAASVSGAAYPFTWIIEPNSTSDFRATAVSSACESPRPIADSIYATSWAGPSRSSRAINEACRLAGTANAEDGTAATVCVASPSPSASSTALVISSANNGPDRCCSEGAERSRQVGARRKQAPHACCRLATPNNYQRGKYSVPDDGGVLLPSRYSHCRRLHVGMSVQQRVPVVMANLANEGRLFGLTPTDWALLLAGMMLCGVLTPLFLAW